MVDERKAQRDARAILTGARLSLPAEHVRSQTKRSTTSGLESRPVRVESGPASF